MVNIALVSASTVLVTSGFGLATYVASQEGLIGFIGTPHILSLLIMLVSYVLSWVAMVWMANPEKFDVRPKQWIAFVFTLLMAIFWWGRYVFTIADTAETAPTK